MARAHVSGARISVSANLVEKCRIKIHDIGHSSWVLHCLAVVENRECSESLQFKCSHSMAAFWCYTFTKSNYTIENHRHCTMSMGSKNSGSWKKQSLRELLPESLAHDVRCTKWWPTCWRSIELQNEYTLADIRLQRTPIFFSSSSSSLHSYAN